MPISKAALFLAAATLLFLSADLRSLLLGALSPIAVAGFIIYLLQPLVNNLQRLSSLPRWICILLSFSLLLALLLVFLLLLLPRLRDTALQLLNLGDPAVFSSPLWIRLRTYLPIDDWLVRLPELLRKLLAPLLSCSAFLLQQLGNLCVSLCIAYYALKENDDLCLSCAALILRLCPPSLTCPLLNLLDILDQTLWDYLRSRLYISLIIALFCTLCFLLAVFLGFPVPSPLLLGCIIALTNLIPLIGPWIGTLLCLLSALFAGSAVLLLVLAVCLTAQLLDNLWLTPRIGSTLRLSPLWILCACAIAAPFGLPGFLAAIPLLMTCVRIWRAPSGFLQEMPERFKNIDIQRKKEYDKKNTFRR